MNSRNPDVDEALSHLEIRNILTLAIHAERLDLDTVPDGAEVEAMMEAQFGAAAGELGMRYQWRFTIARPEADGEDTGAAGEPDVIDNEAGGDDKSGAASIAVMQFTLQLVWTVDDSDYEASTEVVEALAKTVGLETVHPYVRELLQSTSTRLQLPPFVLGRLDQAAMRPRNISMIRR